MWIELATLWRSHLLLLHETSQAAAVSRFTVALIHIRVRTLHSMQSTLPIHRTESFFSRDLAAFLSTFSLNQLRSNVAQYEPIILDSCPRRNGGDQHPPAVELSSMALHPDVPGDCRSHTDTSSRSPDQRAAAGEPQHRKNRGTRIGTEAHARPCSRLTLPSLSPSPLPTNDTKPPIRCSKYILSRHSPIPILTKSGHQAAGVTRSAPP